MELQESDVDGHQEEILKLKMRNILYVEMNIVREICMLMIMFVQTPFSLSPGKATIASPLIAALGIQSLIDTRNYFSYLGLIFTT